MLHRKLVPYNLPVLLNINTKVFAISQILMGWKQYEYCYETVELPNPRPTQPKKNQAKSGIWATFSHSKYFFVGWDWFYIGNRIQ